MTRLILYAQQFVRNSKFSLLSDYEWGTTGTWIKTAGKIESSGAGTLGQEGVFKVGVKYQLQYTISGSSGSGTVVVSDSINVIHNGSTNGTYTIEFTAASDILIFTANSTFNASISNVSAYPVPVNFDLDITDAKIPFKFSIEDILEVNKRKAPRTGSFIIKGTHEVNQAFRQIYLINAATIFNPNLKTKCTVISQGIEFFKGTLCLDDVIEKIDSQKGVTEIEYNVSITESVTDIYSELGEMTVNDLDFSEYDHDFNIEIARQSWLGVIQRNGGSDNNTVTSVTATVASQASVVAGGLNRIEFTFTAPHSFSVGDEVYVRPDITQCNITGGGNYLFNQTVYSVPSSTKIVLECSDPCSPYAAASPSNATSVSNQMPVGYGYYYPCVNNGTYMNRILPIPNGTGELEVGKKYIITIYASGDDFTNVGGVSNTQGEIFTATGTTPTTWNGSLLTVYRDTTIEIGQDRLKTKWLDTSSRATVDSVIDSEWEIYDFIPYLYLREILIKSFALANLEYNCPLFDSKIFRRLIIPMNDPYTLIEGATLQMNDWTPSVKLKDVLNAVLNMFNLSMTQVGNILTFVNRGEYFDNAPVNWSDKLDISIPLRQTMLNKNGAKIYHFKYADSGDYFNQLHDKTYGDVKNTSGLINIKNRKYGDYLIDLESDYLKETNNIEIPFEASVLTSGYGIITGLFGYSTIVMPTHYTSNLDGNNVKRNYVPKILISGPRWNYINPSDGTPANINFSSDLSPGDNLMSSWYYGYAGHIDNHFQEKPTHDLNFTTPLGVWIDETLDCGSSVLKYVMTTNPTLDGWGDNSLYNKYWARYISQITNLNSKKITGRAKLSLIDIYSLDFSRPVLIGDLKLKLISVSDWYIDSDGLCNVEFIITR